MALLKATCLYETGNIFQSFYEPIIPRIERLKPDYIGISLGDYTQLVPGLTLSMLLKSCTKAHVNIGGNLFGRYTDILINEPEFFKLFADSIIFNEGEKPVIQLLKHLKGDIPIEQVPNLIYLQGGRVRINDPDEPYSINELFTPDFSGMPLDRYLTPHTIFNLQASRDCYWRKCSFCTHFFGSRYSVKRVDRLLHEVKDLIRRYDQRHFHFIDEAMGPAYLARLSEEIIAQGLDIDFYIYARMEKEFTPDLFSSAGKAGLRLILWGFESANERIYTLMNKGSLTAKDARREILQNAFDAGIWNYLFVMYGFPSETQAEARETAEFLYENRHICSFSKGSRFVLLDKAPILNDLAKYSISKVQRIRSGFSYAHRYETTSGMSHGEIRDFMRNKDEIIHLSDYRFQNSWSREKLFLYICKYGIERISAMRDNVWI